MRPRGFTLVEVLVAVFVFSIVAALAYGGYNQLTRQDEIVDKNSSRTRAIQSAVQRMAEDFEMIEPRPVREPLGDSVDPALKSDKRTPEILAELTRSGWSNPAGISRSTLQRVAYRMQDNKLERAYWNALDRVMSVEPTSTVLLDQVRTVSFRFMDQNQSWHEQWPPLGYSGADAGRLRPIAVEITLDLEDWGKIVRLVEVAG